MNILINGFREQQILNIEIQIIDLMVKLLDMQSRKATVREMFDVYRELRELTKEKIRLHEANVSEWQLSQLISQSAFQYELPQEIGEN